MSTEYDRPTEEIMDLARQLGFPTAKNLLKNAIDARKRLDCEREYHERMLREGMYEPCPGIHVPNDPLFRNGF